MAAAKTSVQSVPARSLLSYRWELVLWLWLAFFFNQADRQLFGIVLPAIRSDLGLTDTQAGLVVTAFTIAFGCAIPMSGWAGDYFSRKRVVVFSILFWSVATALTGFGTGLIYLIAVRSIATAVGEALFAPAAYALIAEQHQETRAQAMALHQTSLYIGVIATGALAGWMADRFGWRSAFWVFGAGGVVAAGLMQLRIRRGNAGTGSVAKPPSLAVLRIPTVFLLALGLASSVFANIAYLTWMPTYLHEKFGLSLASAGFWGMFYHHAAAFGGVLLGGRISDRLAQRRPVARLWLQAGALVAAAPFLYWMGAAPTLAGIYAGLAGFGFFRGLYDSNTWAAVYQVVRPDLHSSASGLVLAVAFLCAATSPVLLGMWKRTAGLETGLSSLALVHVLGAMVVLMAAIRFFEADRTRMESALSGRTI